MRRSLDFSVGQRLAAGFGLVMAIFTVVVLASLSLHVRSEQAQKEYSERIVPLRDQMLALERSVYRTAIGVRAALVDPTPERGVVARENISEARSLMERLEAEVMDAQSERLLQEVAPAVRTYLEAATALIEESQDGPVHVEKEAALGDLRVAFMGRATDFDILQQKKAQSALARMAEIRDKTLKWYIAAALLAAVALLAVAWLTAASISRPTRNLLKIARAMQAGDWRPALRLAPSPTAGNPRARRDEMARLAAAFGSAAVSLERREKRTSADGDIARAVAGTLQRNPLCEQALKHVVAHLNAAVAVVYCCGPHSTVLHPVASHALDAALPDIAVGEGIPGQAARDRRSMLVSDIPADSGFAVKLGYDQALPRSVAAVPLLFRETLQGVLVVGSLHELDAGCMEFLEASATQLGIGLQNITAHEEIHKLLADVRERNEQVQAQNEELQVQSEELQSQSQQLQVQHEEIQAQNEELIQQSEELRRHSAALAEVDERKNRFLGVLAHELRNPMSPIANSIYILKRAEPGSDGAQRAQAVIERQTAHLSRLIDDLLDVTRISEGKIRIERERLDLVEVIRSCVEDVTAACEQAGLALELELPAYPVEVDGDRTRLCQVLCNLLNNSVKFGKPDGRVKLTLRVDQAAAAAEILVCDDGIGMEETLLPNLFQPFSQGVSGLARVNGGLGLGLALVKSLVALHDGSVEGHSDGPGHGALFRIRLPLAGKELPVPRESAPQAFRAEFAGGRSKRILIIEDNIDAAQSLHEALLLEDFEVELAHSGHEGLKKAQSFLPDVVLCDVGLPGLDGYQVARALRADERTKATILIALTGYASTADKEQAHAAGFHLHLSKPLDVPGLFAFLSGSPGIR